jgi:hypothetical protein
LADLEFDRSLRLPLATPHPMAEPSDLSIDFSTATVWRGVRPGMLRSEVVRILKAAEAEIDDEDTHWQLAMWDEKNLELFFAGEGEEPLREVLVDDEANTWDGRPIIGRPLHEVLATIGDAASGAGWRPENAADEQLEDLNPPGAGPFADESLLSEGTLWLPRKNLGLVMGEGVIDAIVWRRPEDFPRQFVGPITEAQKQLSARPDFREYLRSRRQEISSAQAVPEGSGTQRLLIFAFIVALAWLGWKAFKEQQLWNTAPHIFGKVTEIVEKTGRMTTKLFRVSYAAPGGSTHSAELEPADFYTSPTVPGEEVELAYVDGNPPQVMGLARIRDAAFVRYVPWFIGAAAIYVILNISVRFLARLRRAQEGVVVSPVLPTPPRGPT